MATQSLTSISKSKRSELSNILTGWENRYKLRVLSRNLPRAIIVGLLISIVIGMVGYSQRLLLAQNLAVISLAITGMLGLVVVLYTQLFPRPQETAARYFDVEFGLQERVSTALEILDGHIRTHPDIEAMQLVDALQSANKIDPKLDIEMDFRGRELFALIVLLLGVLAMIVIPLIVGQSPITENPSAAVVAAQEDVEDITETIATDTDLEQIDRDELLNALEIALERLEEENITDEEAFAAMSQLESEISEVENELQETLELDQSALEEASEALGDFVQPSESEENVAGEEDPAQEGIQSAQDLQDALEQIGEDAESFSEEEAQSAADALREAAEQLAESNPELSQALQDAADALEANDSQALQEQLENAQQQLEQQQQQMQQDSDAQQMLQNQSDLAEQAMEEISQQQQQQSQQSSPSDQPQEGEAQSGEQQSGQPGEQESESSRPGEADGGQQPSSNQPGESESENMAQNSDTAGEGAGDGESSNTAMSGGAGEDKGASTDNQATGDGQIQYEAIYDPTGIDGGGSEEIQLEADSGDQPLSEGDFDDNPFGESQVSYDTVFSDYQDAANRALESDYVPLGLRDVVHDYFTSLEPVSGE